MSYTNLQKRAESFALQYASDLMKFRHLCWNLVQSDLRSRFRRSYLGILWAVIQPLAFALIVAAVWHTVFKEGSYLTFAIYVFSGMIVWEFFLTSCLMSLDSLINAQGYLKQARIPFLIFQLRTPMTGLVIFGFGIVGLIIMMIATGQFPMIGFHILLIPVALVLLLLFVMPCCILFSIIGATFRDARYVVNIAFQALFFLSPVMMKREILDAPHLQFIQYLNPVVSMMGLFRDPMVYGHAWRLRDPLVLILWIIAMWALAAIASASSGRKVVFAL